MSDTTKITKARVNGVLYDLGGSGGGTGGISGAYMAPGCLIADKGFSQATIDETALIEQLEKVGINVDECPFPDPSEEYITFTLGEYGGFSNSAPFINSIVSIELNNVDSIASIFILGSPIVQMSAIDLTNTLRQIIADIFGQTVESIELPVPPIDGLDYITNITKVVYTSADVGLTYYIPDMTEFCEEVIVEGSGGSSSSSSN